MEETAEEVQRWFAREVTYEGEPYTIDREQAAAVAGNDHNAIVAARAGSGKTRTIVAKMTYLIARRGARPEEIIAFVFNSNAAAEINARLAKMMVNGVPVVEGEGVVRRDATSENGQMEGTEARLPKIAVTFHAFARRIVYSVGGKEKCGQILAGEKEDFVRAVLARMGRVAKVAGASGRQSDVGSGISAKLASAKYLDEMTGLVSQFINRAQQRYLGEEASLFTTTVTEYLQGANAPDGLGPRDLSEREREFLTLGLECYKLYHYYLLNRGPRGRLPPEYIEYGTDFNLIMSWAAKIICEGRAEAEVSGKKYILIDEYQDFSYLFLSVVRAIRARAETAKLFVVGDDWQAINRFAGSEVEYFKEFERYFEDGTRRYEISTNYRCDSEIVETARKFMEKAMREKGNFRAKSRRAGKVVVVNPRETPVKYAMTSYDKRAGWTDLVVMQAARQMLLGRVPKKKTVQYIKTLARIMRQNRKAAEILLLHRNNETGLQGATLTRLGTALKWMLVRTGVMTGEEYDSKVRLMTMHKSKGLEAEVVIILEADEGVIPKSHPDTRLFTVFGETERVALDDQKRLFYVAMTRAKKRLYVIYSGDPKKPEGFVKYLGRGYFEEE